MSGREQRRRSRSARALAAALLLCGAARGGEEVVVSGTRTAEASQRAVVRVEVVGKDEIERRGALTVADA
ncbi:MAG: hypothetical protein MUF64_13020, partial [Polyangiaceae bacterium]|nr:hypothetical protein [Polyangiaceae bacterium]